MLRLTWSLNFMSPNGAPLVPLGSWCTAALQPYASRNRTRSCQLVLSWNPWLQLCEVSAGRSQTMVLVAL